MPRKLRVEFPGAIYHVTTRGNQQQPIFKDDSDRKRLLQRLAESIEDYTIRLFLYCLMPNHVHLVLETPRGNLSRFMQSWLTGYTVYYNQRHRQTGHLFQGRYGAKLVEGDRYLLALSRYVHLNPIHVAGMQEQELKARIQYLRQYAWSSYRAYTGKIKVPEWLTPGPIWAEMGGLRQKTCLVYQRYVEAGLAESDKEFEKLIKSTDPVLGSEEFKARVHELADEKKKNLKRPEDAEFRLEKEALSVEEILQKGTEYFGWQIKELLIRRRGDLAKALAAKLLCKFSKLTNREIAPFLGLQSGAAVGWQRRQAEKILKNDPKLQSQWAALTNNLDQINKRHVFA